MAGSAPAALAVAGRRRAERVRLDVTNALSRLAGMPLDPGATSEAAVSLAVGEPVGGSADECEEPQDGID